MRLPRVGLGLVSPSSPVVQQLANAIFTQEGPTKNNNPGNLKYVGQTGAIGADSRGFAIFPTLAAGQQAAASQISLDINRGSCANGAALATLSDLITCWSTTDQAAYIQHVSQATGLDPSQVLSQLPDYTGGNGLITPSELTTGGVWSDTADAGTGGDSVAIFTAVGVGLLAWVLFRR